MQARPTMNKTLQLWFTRSDINQLSINRAKLGYGFATIPGSAKGNLVYLLKSLIAIHIIYVFSDDRELILCHQRSSRRNSMFERLLENVASNLLISLHVKASKSIRNSVSFSFIKFVFLRLVNVLLRFPGIRRMSHKLNSKTATREDKITFRNKVTFSH
jgi:hypothetical protein